MKNNGFLVISRPVTHVRFSDLHIAHRLKPAKVTEPFDTYCNLSALSQFLPDYIPVELLLLGFALSPKNLVALALIAKANCQE